MSPRNPQVDAYIATSPDFARPILTQIRDAVHAACPDVEESIKWGCPHFSYNGMLCGIASFKEHCRLHFWRGESIVGDAEQAEKFHRIESVETLPSRPAITRAVRRAMQLNDERERSPATKTKTKKTRPPLPVPPVLASALQRNAAARAFFETLPPSHRRDYIEWITEARTEPTRDKRVATTVEWLAEGKSRNWKYEKKHA